MALLKYIFFLFLLTISLPGFLNAQKYFSSQYITTQDGLSNNKITCLHEDIKGNLWIGTEEGLTRFNGVIFEKYFADINQPTQSLSSNFIKYIVQQNDSLLLISTQSGVNVFNLHTDRFENNLIADLLVRAGSGTDISALRLAGGKKILIATNDRIIIADEKLKTIKSISTTTKWGERFYVSQNNIYIDNDSTEFIFSKGKYGGNAILDLKNDSFFSAVKKFSFLSPFENTPFGPLFHANNGLYFYSAYSYGFFVHDTSGNHTENFEISPAGGEFNSVNMIITDVNLASTYWLATGNGLYLFNASDKKLTRCIISTEKDNAPAGRGNYLLIDTQKTLWFGTSNGLYKLTCNAMSFEKIFELEQHGLPEDGLNLCFADAKGRAWFGSFGSGLFEKEMYQSSERVKHFVECGMLITKINSVAGRIYAASEKGLMFFDEGKQKFLYPSFYPDSLKGRIVTDFNFDKGGIFRLGLGNGLGMTELNTISGGAMYFNHYNFSEDSSDYLPIRQPTFFAEDKNRNLWCGYNYGDKLMFYHREKKTYSTLELTVNGTAYNNFSAASMFVDSQNRLWFGTYNFGLLVHEIITRKTFTLTRSQGLPGEICNEILEDCFGNIWIGTNNGLAKYETKTGKIFSITSKEGLPVEQVVWMHYSIIENDTTMLIGDYKSAYTFNPQAISFYSEAPAIYITKVLLDNSAISELQNKFRYNQSHLGFEFIGINLISGDRNKYAYRLLPIDKDWIYCGGNRNANYNNLVPGSYEFNVKCANASGIWSDEASYSFIVSPAFWQTWWFKILIALAAAIVVYYIYRIRFKRAIEIEKMRSRISRDLHDDIGSTLSSINILSNATLVSSEKKTNTEIDNVLKKINVNSQNMLDNMDDIIWSINPSNDKGNKLLTRMREYATQILDAADIEIEFDFDDQVDSILLDMEQKRSVYLVFKEAVNNLAKYSKSKTAFLAINFKNNFIEMSIKDSGVGFDLVHIAYGNGIINMKKRAGDVNAQLNIESSQANGTTISMHMRL